MTTLVKTPTIHIYFPWSHKEEVVVEVIKPFVRGAEGKHSFTLEPINGVMVLRDGFNDRYLNIVRPHLHLLLPENYTAECEDPLDNLQAKLALKQMEVACSIIRPLYI